MNHFTRLLHTLFFGVTTFGFLLALCIGDGPLVLAAVGFIGSACGLTVSVLVD